MPQKRRTTDPAKNRKTKVISAPGDLSIAGEKTAEVIEGEPFFIVGLGASAGGLEAFEKFFTNTPPDSGLAFVVIVHLDPHHKTLLPELLARYTRMEVTLAEEGVKIEPNTVYIIPANRDMTLSGGLLHLDEQVQPRGVRYTIDHFLRSLAEDAEENAVAVILSGTGSDGTQGVKAVKAAGGLVFVEDEQSAKYYGMPQSAIATGVADLVLPAEQIPAKLVEFTNRPLLTRQKGKQPERDIAANLRTIFRLVNKHTGHDFSSYKVNTMVRRIERRMVVNEILRIEDYVALLKENPEENKALFHEVLIGVTSFFRDPLAFSALNQLVIPQMFQQREPDEPVRIWLSGCATGEEAYSVAILVREYMREHRLEQKVQIFATDLDQEAIVFARDGVYSTGIAADLSEERLKTFFRKTGDRFEVLKQLREMIVFAQHNLIRDPPFSRLDLLVCRNLLIYLNPEIQKRLLPMFHQLLRPNGFLFLGTSETVGSYTDLFHVVDKKWKLFGRRESARRIGVEFPAATPLMPRGQDREGGRGEDFGSIKPGQLAERILIQRYSPPCVVINEKQQVLYYSTRTAKFLEPPVGEPTQDILRMARENLRPALRAAIHKTLKTGEAAIYSDLRVVLDEREELVTLRVEPISHPAAVKGLALVIFESAGLRPTQTEPPKAAPRSIAEGEKDQIIAQLEEQLRITNDELQSTVERLETSNEEMKSSNEELMSMNEEFQSTNEELETSKEELQALNEELVTINSELESKVDELGQANNDMQNLLNSSAIATIFLDRKLQVKRFTPKAADLFNLIDGDVGRPLQHLSGKVAYPELQQDAKRVLESLAPIERELTADQTHFLMRLLPYRTMEDAIEGVVVTFIDITSRRNAEAYRARLAAIVEASTDAVVGKTLDGIVTSWNPGAERMYGYRAKEMIDQSIQRIVPEERRKELAGIFTHLKKGERIEKLETERICKDQRRLQVALSISPIYNEQGEVVGAASIARDVTEEKQRQFYLEKTQELGKIGAWEVDLPRGSYVCTEQACRILGVPQGAEGSYQSFLDMVHPDDRDYVDRTWQAAANGQPHDIEHRIIVENEVKWVREKIDLEFDENGQAKKAIGFLQDISQLRGLEERVNQAEKMEAIGHLAGGIAHDFNNQLASVLGFSDLLINKVGEPKLQDYARHIKRSAERAKGLTQQLLAFSRRGKTIAKPVQVHKSLHEVGSILEHSIDKRIQLRQTFTAEPATIIGDAGQLQNALLNIAINARDAMPNGGELIFETLVAELDPEFCQERMAEVVPGRYLVINISDTGSGISPEHLPKIFQPFFTTKEAGKGTGMGLASTFGTIKSHGGFIDVKSQLGKGATFSIYLPLPAEIVNEPVVDQGTGPVPGNGRILLVDDEEPVRTVTTALLEELGYQAATYPDGQSAVDYYRQHWQEISLVILDMIMPGLNGRETFVALREINPNALVVLSSGYSAGSAAQAIIDEGGKGFIAKPFDQIELSRIIAQVLKKDMGT